MCVKLGFWSEGKIEGMRARGGHQVDFSWKDGTVTDYRIRSIEPGTVQVRVNGKVKTVKTESI